MLEPALRPGRWPWLALAYVSLALAIVGAAVPLLPTTPFVLLAAFAGARGSSRFSARLHRHPMLGRVLRDWTAHRAVGRRAKLLASATMALSAAVLLAGPVPVWAAAAVIGLMASVSLWLWLRPEPPRP